MGKPPEAGAATAGAGPQAFDWWMACLGDLVWPAEGLGPWDPDRAPVMAAAQLRRLLAAARRPAQRNRLRRIMGQAPQATSSRPSPRPAARAWLAESLLDKDARRAFSLLQGLPGPRAALYRGAALMKLKRWREAADAFVLAEGSAGGAASALPALLAGAAWLRAGSPQGALQALARSQAGGCDEAALHWLTAYALQRLGRQAEAGCSVERAMHLFSELALDPLLGAALRRENQPGLPPSRRTLSLLAAIRRGPTAAWALVQRAESLRSPAFSLYAEAAPLLRRAARLAPRSPWVWAYLGRGLDSVGDPQGAKRALDRAAALAPTSGWIRAWRGSWLMRHGLARQAVPELKRAVVLIPDYPFARAWLGGALRRTGRLDAAAAELELGSRREPCYEWTFAELFQLRRRRKDWAAAAAMLTQAYEHDMKFTWARRDDPESCRRALKELDGALRSRPGLPLLRAWRDWIRLGLGAVGAVKAGRREPAFVHAVAAESEERQGRLERALPYYDRAVALAPCAAYLGARGCLLVVLGRPRAALADLRRAVALNGTEARFQCALGTALLETRQPRAAIEAFDRALGLDPRFCEALAKRADAWAVLGKPVPARRDLTRARRLRPDCPWAALAAARLATDDVRACAEFLKVVERGGELPPRLLAAVRRRMGGAARRALRSLRRA